MKITLTLDVSDGSEKVVHTSCRHELCQSRPGAANEESNSIAIKELLS